MTKFGEQLRQNCIVQWKDAYLNYALLKRLLKQLRTSSAIAERAARTPVLGDGAEPDGADDDSTRWDDPSGMSIDAVLLVMRQPLPQQSEKKRKHINYNPSRFDRSRWPTVPALVPLGSISSSSSSDDSSATALDDLRRTLALSGEAVGRVLLLEMVFGMHVQSEVEKIDAHYRQQFAWLEGQVQRARAQMRAVRSTALQREARHAEMWGHGGLPQHDFARKALECGESGRRIRLACHEIFRMMLLLRDYAALNYIGLVKIMKKHDKLGGWDASPRVLAEIREHAFHKDAVQQRTWAFGRLGILIDELEDFYATSFMANDRAAAKRALVLAAHTTTRKMQDAGEGARASIAQLSTPPTSPRAASPSLPRSHSGTDGSLPPSPTNSPSRKLAHLWQRAKDAPITRAALGTSSREYMVSDAIIAEEGVIPNKWWWEREGQYCNCVRKVVGCCGCDPALRLTADLCGCATGEKAHAARLSDFALGAQLATLLLGALIGMLYLVYTSAALHDEDHFVRSFPAFRFAILLAAHIFGFSVDVVAWHSARIDYAFLLGLNSNVMARTSLFQLYRIASCCIIGVALSLGLFIGLGQIGGELEWQRSWITLAVVGVVLPIFVSPWGCAKPWRSFVVKQIVRVVCGAGACTTTFQASFIADQLCSQARLITDVLYLLCWLPSGAFFTRSGDTVQACARSVVYTRVIATALPYTWRLLQCLRQVAEGVLPHLRRGAKRWSERRRIRLAMAESSTAVSEVDDEIEVEIEIESDSGGSGAEGSSDSEFGANSLQRSSLNNDCGCCDPKTFKGIWIPIMNSGKYTASLLVVVASTWGTREMWMCAALFAGLYAFIWDTVADWGLLHVWQSKLTTRQLCRWCRGPVRGGSASEEELGALLDRADGGGVRSEGVSMQQHRRRSEHALVAAALHETWRSSHIDPSTGAFAPCIKTLPATGNTEYDIASLTYEELPVEIQEMNLKSAAAACKFIENTKAAGEPIHGPVFFERASANQCDVHRSLANFQADKDFSDISGNYDELAEKEKERYRGVVRIALRHYYQHESKESAAAGGGDKLSMMERAGAIPDAGADADEDADEDADDDAAPRGPPRVLRLQEMAVSPRKPGALPRVVTFGSSLSDMAMESAAAEALAAACEENNRCSSDGGGGSGGGGKGTSSKAASTSGGADTRRISRTSEECTAGIEAEARAEQMQCAVVKHEMKLRSQQQRARSLRKSQHLGALHREDDAAALGHALLRKKLLAPAWVYYAALPVNALLRLAWTLSISPSLSTFLGNEFFVLVIALLEIMRRCIWNFFRLEHAQVSNWEGFQETRRTELETAEDLCRRTLYERHRMLGPDHVGTLTSLNNLGVVLHAQGKLAEAAPLLRSALDKKEALEGGDNAATLTVMTNLALLLEAMGNVEEADVLLHRALHIYEKTLGYAHPSTLSFASNLAELLTEHGEAGRARPLFNRALLGTSDAWRIERNDSSLRRIPWHLSSSAIEYTVQSLVV